MKACMNPGTFISGFHFVYQLVCLIIISLISSLISTKLLHQLFSQVKLSSGLSEYTSVLDRNFYTAGQRLPYLRINHLHKISDTQTTIVPEFSLR